jgi:PRTRC genetic system protein B
MEPTLSSTITRDDQTAIAQILAGDLLKHLNDVDAVILIYNNHYFYRGTSRRSPGLPECHEFKCLSPQTLQAAFSQSDNDSGWLQPNVNRHGRTSKGDWVIWFERSRRYQIQVEQKILTIPLPSLVLVGLNQQYWIFAVKGKQFSPDLKLFRAPVPNVHQTGQICWGNNKPPSASPASMQSAFSLFIESTFNGDLAVSKSRKYDLDIRLQLSALHHRNAKSYPLSDLVGQSHMESTVENIITQLKKYDTH